MALHATSSGKMVILAIWVPMIDLLALIRPLHRPGESTLPCLNHGISYFFFGRPAASGNPSQMAFSPDGKYLLVAIKGFLPTDPNNASKKMMQGFIGVYTVSDYSLSKTYVKNTVPAPAGFPFSIQNDLFVKDAYFSTDVLDGALLSTLDSTGHLAMAPAAIMPQAAASLLY